VIAYNNLVTIPAMSRGQFLAKFKNVTHHLVDAVEDKVDLEYDHPSLYDELISHYKQEAEFDFYGDKDKDYNVVLDKLEYDLMNTGVMQ
tara:strand:+ start:2395 stop:2661 length:267 start_codon:yes stop_codon:yes gene_type:complete